MRRQQGSVLILTLWLMAGLASAALLFAHSAMLNYRGGSNRIAALQAEHAGEAVLQYVLQVIAGGTPGEMPAAEEFVAEDLRVGGCRVWILARAAQASATGPVFGLMDEAGKLNLNTAEPEMMQALQGMTDDLAGAIVDWRDVDSDISPNGAESETYLGFSPPSVAKDAPFETVGELGMLNGADPALLNGRDRNRNGYLEEWERKLAQESTQRFAELPDRGFLDLFTVHSQEPNLTPDGEERANLNARVQGAPAALSEILGAQRAVAVAQYAGLGTTQFRSVLEFCIRAGLDESETEQVMTRFTVASGTVVQGLVNVNTAPAAVLAALPGIGEDLAEQLVTYRGENADSRTTPLWVVAAVGQDAALAAAPYITTKSYQVTADIVAVAPNGRAFRRVSTIIDTSSGTPVIVSRRDLTQLGWPLGTELHAELIGQVTFSVPLATAWAGLRKKVPGFRVSGFRKINVSKRRFVCEPERLDAQVKTFPGLNSCPMASEKPIILISNTLSRTLSGTLSDLVLKSPKDRLGARQGPIFVAGYSANPFRTPSSLNPEPCYLSSYPS